MSFQELGGSRESNSLTFLWSLGASCLSLAGPVPAWAGSEHSEVEGSGQVGTAGAVVLSTWWV